MKDILTPTDVELLVDTFYDNVRKDELLAPIFNQVIGDRWPTHLKKMYGFWQTVLLNVQAYTGSPFLPHANLPIGAEHFAHWIALFNQTVDTLFDGDKANEAKWRAARMAEMFQYKIEHYKNNPAKPIM